MARGFSISLLVLVACFAARVVAVPMFVGPLFRTTYLDEESSVGTSVIDVSATDPAGGSFTFDLGSPSTYFSIDANTGAVTVASPPDRETNPAGIQFTVVILDSGGTQSAASLLVTIVLNDINDNSPTWFNDPGVPIQISEDTSIGRAVFNFQVTDRDIGDNGDFSFFLLSPADGTFSINSISGALRLGRRLDFDVTDSYSVMVSVQDNGNPALTTMLSLTINILAVLDAPPIFSQGAYTARVPEGVYTSSPMVLLRLQAADNTRPDAIIMYEQQTRGDSSDTLFSVTPLGSNAGELMVAGDLDRETVNTYTLNVQAYRVNAAGTIRSVRAFTAVTITVTDVNDNDPVWQNPTTDTFTLLESTRVGTSIYSLVVIDIDEGVDGEVSYSVTSPSDGTFAVSNLGVVTLNRELNFIATSSYAVTIVASDGGNPALTLSIPLNVMVIDVIEPPPQFTQEVYQETVIEGDYTGTQITTVIANSPTSAPVRYSISFAVPGFSVDATSGVVSFTGTLDREGVITFAISVQAFEVNSIDMTTPTSGMSFASVIVLISDANDNSPTFFNTHYQGSVSELAPIGHITVAGVGAFDLDLGSNSAFSFSILDSTNAGPFAIDSASGVITVNGQLDFETTESYTFSIAATETMTTQMNQGTAGVVVIVSNENDNSPVFPFDTYLFDTNEGPAGSTLTSVTPAGLTMIAATDADKGVFGEITYTLLGFGSETPVFAVSATGVITTIGELDRETRQIYHLTLIAQDGGTDPNRGTTLLIINVLDINDNPPMFIPDNYMTILLEGTDYPNLLTLQATDRDMQGTANSMISYSIANQDGSSVSNNFQIDSSSGSISAFNLDCETIASFSLQVTATDMGTNPGALTGTATLAVTIQCINELAPIFNPPTYTATISESLTVGSPIGVTATATDSEGHTVQYSISGSAPDGRFFSIDEMTGVMSLAHVVDSDPPNNHAMFSLTILARDDAANPMTGTATVMVTVTNVNDNTPIITNPPEHDPTRFTIIEAGGTAVPNPLLTVEASDLDGDAVTYAVTSGTGFTIDSVTGVLQQTAALDRETSPIQSVVITACDAEPLCDTVTLTITVADYNDNAPVFDSLTYTATVSECDATAHFPVATVLAVDNADIGPNADVTYSLVGGSTSLFTIDSSSGVVRLAGNAWDFESGTTTFSVTVRGTDNPNGSPQLDTAPMDATVTITLTDCNDNPPMFNSDDYTIIITEGSTSADNPVFMDIMITDHDGTAVNRARTFQIIGGTASANNWLDIDSATGVFNILAGQTIDREDPFLQIDSVGRGQMTFDVRVTNSAPSAVLSATATVTVLVADINDHDPIIDQSDPISVSVVEHALNASIISIITATDQDSGDNAHIAFSITAGNDANNFAIGRESGHLIVVGDLDREGVNMFTLTVQAENDLATGGTPDTVTVNVQVIGTNDFNPVFDAGQYNTTLIEYDSLLMVNGVAAGDTIQTVHATDADGTDSPAGLLEYRIASGHFIEGEMVFDIPIPSQGAVVILRPDLIDFERDPQFDLVIVAYDLVTPENERRQGSTHLIVSVVDVNDNMPVFSDDVYNATITEEEPVGTAAIVFPTIRATDADDNGMDALTYRLVSAHPFTISTDGMTVSNTARIDRETTPLYEVTVVVQDSNGHTASSQLLISVLDTNDNAPRFLRTPAELQVNIPENLAIFPHQDSLVQTVTAVDDDTDNNAQITYLLSGHRGNFDITMSTGQVRLIAELDRDTIASRYDLNVTATDGTLSSWLVFTVIIDNVNDNNPVFTQPVWVGTIDEDATVGTTVLSTDSSSQVIPLLQIVAEDLDPASNVTYFLAPSTASPAPPFDVTADGYIVTTGLLDRESQARFSFAVRATDGFRESLEDTLIELEIADVNDQAPVFEQPSYNTEVYELTPANAIFLILRAEDADVGPNAEIEYTITEVIPPGSTGFFAIDINTGALSPTQDVLVGASDPRTITLQVTATDKGLQSQSTPVQVELNLVDRNLNAPNFTQILYSFTVPENLLDRFVGNPIAMDASGDPNSIISYSIVGNSDGFQSFSIDNETGMIFTADRLDRETRDLYTLTISATDSDAIPRTGFATVAINVGDENDNDPFFDPDVYPIAISESTSANSVVIRVFGFDNDAGTNAELSYRILSGDSSVFSVDNTGVITTLTEIDREVQSNYVLIIEATDAGPNPRTARTNVTILINDVNDNSPMFTAGAVLSNTSLEVLEDAESGFVLTTIQAMDPDFQLNGIVGYYFQSLTLSQGPFQIDRDTGVISLRADPDGQLDRERQDFYDLTVIAADLRGLGVNIRTTTGTIRVAVQDINDNIPTFINPLYEFTIPEAFPLNTPFGTIEGNDLDIGSNAELYYHMIGGSTMNSSCANQFCVDLITGELTLIQPLDRETEDSHLVTVAVSNNMVLEINTTTGAPVDASTGSVSVTVSDTNDQSPVFIEASLFAAVAEEAAFGTTITTLQATDSDTLNGSIVWYEIVTPQVPYLVDRDTGAVTTAGVFTGLSGTRHEVTVRAFDNFGIVPTFSTTGIMIVQVFKTTEQVILTFSRDKETIEAKQSRLHAALVQVTQARITITEVRVQQTEAGEVDISGTDVIFFALDPVNGNVLNPSIIIRIIDENFRVAEDIFTECQLTTIRAHPELVGVSLFTVPVWLWVVLGILVLAVICMCCCFLIGCVVERRRSRRWKKKAATGQHQSQMEQFSHMTDYSAMNNPLWVSPYDEWDNTSSTVSSGSTKERDNPLYESQELTIEMFQDDGEDDVTGSREHLVKAPPLSMPDPVITKRSDGLYDSQEIEIHMYDDLEEPDTESDVQLLRTSTPHGLAGKKGRGKTSSRDDRLLAAAIGDTSADSQTSFI